MEVLYNLHVLPPSLALQPIPLVDTHKQSNGKDKMSFFSVAEHMTYKIVSYCYLVASFHTWTFIILLL